MTYCNILYKYFSLSYNLSNLLFDIKENYGREQTKIA